MPKGLWRIGAIVMALGSVNLAAAEPAFTSEQEAWLTHADRHERAGWIFLHIEGRPLERGFQHGYLLAREIAISLRACRRAWEHDSGMEWSWLVEQSKKMYTPRVDAEDLAEIDGIVEGMKAAGVTSSRDEIVAYNGSIDLADYWWPIEKKKHDWNSPDRPKDSCSSFIATGSYTADRGVVLGHNTMFGYIQSDANVVLDVVPEKGHRILMQTQPGWVHSGTDFFITDAGLVGSETTIGGFNGFDEKGVPEFVRMRRATQDASSIDEWCAIMKKGNNGGYANAWLLGNIHSGEIARLELGLRNVGMEKSTDGYFVGSNIAENMKILRLETDEKDTDIRLSGVARRVRWKRLMKEYAGRIDAELAEKFEGDHYDTYLEKDNSPDSRTLCAHRELDMQSPGDGVPYNPGGTFDAKVVDSTMAGKMSFAARWGSGCGMAFDAKKFLEAHPQFDWMGDDLKSRPAQPWVVFTAGEKP